MLKLKGINNDREIVFIEFDDYIPFDINIGKKKFKNLYFRYGDGKRSLLEIAVNLDDCVMTSCTLIMIKKENIKKTNITFKNHEYIFNEGTVIFDIAKKYCNNNLEGFFIDNFDSDIYMDLGHNYIALRFSINHCDIESYIINDRLVMGFDSSKKLCAIILIQVSLYEIKKFKSSLN